LWRTVRLDHLLGACIIAGWQATYGRPNISTVPIADSRTPRQGRNIHTSILAVSAVRFARPRSTCGLAIMNFSIGKSIRRSRPPLGKGGADKQTSQAPGATKVIASEVLKAASAQFKRFGTSANVRCWGPTAPADSAAAAMMSSLRRLLASGQEFYAVCVAATPNDFAWLALRMSWDKHQSEPVSDVNPGVRHDFGATRRDVQYEAFELRQSAVDRNPGRLFVQLPPRFALYLYPWLVNGHSDHPRWT
jgi:hypothetical protein